MYLERYPFSVVLLPPQTPKKCTPIWLWGTRVDSAILRTRQLAKKPLILGWWSTPVIFTRFRKKCRIIEGNGRNAPMNRRGWNLRGTCLRIGRNRTIAHSTGVLLALHDPKKWILYKRCTANYDATAHPFMIAAVDMRFAFNLDWFDSYRSVSSTISSSIISSIMSEYQAWKGGLEMVTIQVQTFQCYHSDGPTRFSRVLRY